MAFTRFSLNTFDFLTIELNAKDIDDEHICCLGLVFVSTFDMNK